jgi:hypothetical protein
MENGWWDFAITILIPSTLELVIHNQKDVKARRIILDAMKDHLIPRQYEKKSTREMFLALTNIF